ncbi:metallopeptidase family protein [Gleimia hominis]|uniref:Metallopeptidase family protein n=1 Tax=Gleimia hominis TaxID=595468 RepID=A0ABU3IAD1_9ACTO|nr:metallopeptidase family protein [Gleimia hominis]MDT3767339.1 metallopeptidase family protein [Gleimia hominis]
MRPVVRNRDRHGRGARGPLFSPVVPARRTWSESFNEIVMMHANEMAARYPQLREIEVAVEDCPPVDPAPWESPMVNLCRAFAVDRMAGLRARIILYRLPISYRAGRASHREFSSGLHAFVRALLAEQFGDLTGINRDDLLRGPND